MTFRNLCFHFLLIISLWGCAKQKSSTETIQEVGIPSIYIAETATQSEITIPIALSLKSIESEVNHSIPWMFQNLEWPQFSSAPCQQPEIRYQVQRDSIHLRAEGTTMYFEMDLLYSIEGQICATCWDAKCITPKIPFSCGLASESKRKIHWVGKIMWGLDQQYQLRTVSETIQLVPLDPCEVTFLKINVTDLVVTEMSNALKSALKEADQTTKQWDTKKLIQQWSDQLYQGFSIADYGVLSAQMEKVYIHNIQTQQDSLLAVLGLETILKWMPMAQENARAPLPKVFFESPPRNGFQIALYAQWTWKQINQLFAKNILHRNWPIDDNGGYVMIREAQLKGDKEGRMTAEWVVDFQKGKIKRRNVKVTASMEVRWDESAQAIQLLNFDWDVNTRHLLLKWGIKAETWNQDWQKLQFSLAPYHTKAVVWINDLLKDNTPTGWKIEGGVDDVKVENLKAHSEGITIDFRAIGSVQVKVSDWKRLH